MSRLRLWRSVVFVSGLGCLAGRAFPSEAGSAETPPPAAVPSAALSTAEAVDAAILAGRAACERRAFAEAEAQFQRALALDPADERARLALARAEEDHCLAQPAQREYRRVLRANPASFDALAGLARTALKEHDPDDAIRFARGALRLRPRDGALHAVLARALTGDSEYGEARRSAEEAIVLAPRDGSCHAALATILFRLGDLDGSRRELFETLRNDGSNAYAHHRLGTGSGSPFDDDERSEFSRAAIGRATELLGERRAPEARPLLEEALRRGSSDDYKLHHLLALCLTENDLEAHALAGFEEYRTLFDSLPEPEPDGVERLFPDYESLTPRERKTVVLAAAPLRRYVPALLSSGATHRILALDRSVCDLDEFRNLRDQRTFDRRLYAHVRGLGGRSAVTGREYLWEAADFRYNTLAHELAHQIHLRAFSPAERERIERLYSAAVSENRCLDYYARSDSSEYFAQGYEAFVSLFKHPCLSVTACHTRAELAKRDPGLFEFLTAVTDRPHETREFLRAFYERIGQLSQRLGRYREAERFYAAALELGGSADDPENGALAERLRITREAVGSEPAPVSSAAAPAPETPGLGN